MVRCGWVLKLSDGFVSCSWPDPENITPYRVESFTERVKIFREMSEANLYKESFKKHFPILVDARILPLWMEA